MLNVMLAPIGGHADGGAVHLREASGPFVVTVFTAPEVPRAGPIDTSVLVQDRDTGAVILDTTVNLELQPIGGTDPSSSIRARLGQAKNRLLQTVTIDVPAPGWWAAPRLATFWPFLILPPLAVGLFALHQTLRHSRLL
jgi:hypothetical protein